MLCAFFLLSASIQAKKISEVKIDGNLFFTSKQIFSAMKQKKGRQFDKIVFKEDKNRILNFYRSKGFLDAKLPVYDYEETENGISVKIVIDEDFRTVINDVKIFGNTQVSDETLLKILNIRKNDPLNYYLINQKQMEIMDYYAKKGFIYVGVNYELFVKENRYRQILYLSINENKKAYIRSVSVDSIPDMTRNPARYEVSYRRGDIYTPQKVYGMQQQIYSTGLYNFVGFKTEGIADESDSIDVIFFAEERKRNWVSGGLLYQFPGKIKATAGYGNDNLFKNGEQFSAEFSGAINSLRNNWIYAIFRYYSPYSFNNLVAYSLNVGLNREINEYYEKKDISVKTGISKSLKMFSVANNYNYRLSIIDTTIDSLRYRYERVTTNSTELLALYDRRDDILMPKKGYYVNALFECAGGIFKGYNNFTKYVLEASAFKTYMNAVTLGYRLKAGLIAPYGVSVDRGISISEQFTLGGMSSVRGFEQDSIGPLNQLGTHSGMFLINGNFEARILVYKIVGMTYFFDTGALTERVAGTGIDNAVLSGGIGAFVTTPFGNIRFDIARPLNKSGDMQYYFSLGNPF